MNEEPRIVQLARAERPHLQPGPLPQLPAGVRAAGTPAVPRPRAGPGTAGPRGLPAADRVLAVIARPGQESADLGIILAAYRLRGAVVAVLCLTRGESSELNSTCERLENVRPWELQAAADVLGVSSLAVADYPDGRLGYLPVGDLMEHIGRAVRRSRAGLLLVIDPAAACDLDTAAVAGAARQLAQRDGLGVLARTLPGPGQRWRVDLGADEHLARACQRRAVAAHASQRAGGWAQGTPVPGPRGGPDLVRWLLPPVARAPARRPGPAATR